MTIQIATSPTDWDTFLISQPWSPFLQSWTMGEVYRNIGQEPIRLEIRDGDNLIGICQAIVVPARRGKHLMVQYGPVVNSELLIEELKKIAKEKGCCFIRISPFIPKDSTFDIPHSKNSPMHILAEHVWFLHIQNKTEEELLKNMRQNHRNLIRRAIKEGVTVSKSTDIECFIQLHQKTRNRHKFTPYSDDFFRAQFSTFSPQNRTLYIASYNGEPLAASIHMHFGHETSYHHGASSDKHSKIPASYLLQWTAIKDAISRGDRIYNFWGIAPHNTNGRHPFAGVTIFKTGFGGERLELMHCIDIPISKVYYLTRLFETIRKWKRGL
jgi:peptidoglycan pentaglycine glycine transferase (the first glycine)